MYFGTSLYWRETHRQPRFLIFDSRLVVTLLVLIMHVRIWTILLAIFCFSVLWFFERKGVSPDSIFRYLRARLVGRRRTARGLHNERSCVDYGFETSAHKKAVEQKIEMRRKAEEKMRKKSAQNASKKK